MTPTNEHKDQAPKHVDELKRDIVASFKDLLTQFTQELIEGLPNRETQVKLTGKTRRWYFVEGYNQALTEATQSIKATLTKWTEGK